jgi:hypothetical protein
MAGLFLLRFEFLVHGAKKTFCEKAVSGLAASGTLGILRAKAALRMTTSKMCGFDDAAKAAPFQSYKITSNTTQR